MSNIEECRMLYSSGGQGELFCPQGRFSSEFCKGCCYALTIYKPCNIHSSVKIGGKTQIGAFCDIGRNVRIGKNCNIQAHVTISNGCRIGDNVFIGPNTSFLNDKYPPSHLNDPIVVRDNAVIGGGVTILPGVVIYEGMVVGAGSVVTKDFGLECVVAGNPAREIMNIFEYQDKQKLWKFKRPMRCPKCGCVATWWCGSMYECQNCGGVEIKTLVIDAKELFKNEG